jgi:hypothetical protein
VMVSKIHANGSRKRTQILNQRTEPLTQRLVCTSASAHSCRIEFVILAVTPIAGRGAEGDRRQLDQDDLDAIGVLDPRFGQASGLGCGLPDDGDSGRGQPGVLGVDIPYLDPDHHRMPAKIGCVPGHLK